MGKKEKIEEKYEDIFEEKVKPVVEEKPVVKKKEYKSVMEVAQAVAKGEIKADVAASLGFNKNDVIALANHFRNSK